MAITQVIIVHFFNLEKHATYYYIPFFVSAILRGSKHLLETFIIIQHFLLALRKKKQYYHRKRLHIIKPYTLSVNRPMKSTPKVLGALFVSKMMCDIKKVKPLL